jgi:hypothetical protein
MPLASACGEFCRNGSPKVETPASARASGALLFKQRHLAGPLRAMALAKDLDRCGHARAM